MFWATGREATYAVAGVVAVEGAGLDGAAQLAAHLLVEDTRRQMVVTPKLVLASPAIRHRRVSQKMLQLLLRKLSRLSQAKKL